MCIEAIVLCTIVIIWGVVTITGDFYDSIQILKERYDEDGNDLWAEDEEL